jgi:HD-GYP domain-containing protein (c-di-GMP phosphodiesterase class II)
MQYAMFSPLEVVFDVFSGLVLLTDSGGIIVDYKIDRASHLYPISEKSLQKSIQDFFPQGIRSQTLQILEKAIETGKNTFLKFNLVIENKEEWFEARFSPTKNSHIIIVIQNITEQKEKETQLQRQHKWIETLRVIDRIIASSMDLSLTLSLLLKHVITQLEVDAADILILKKNKPDLEYSVGFGFRTPILDNPSVRLGVGYAGKAALERRVIHITNLSNLHNGFLHPPTLSQEGFVDYYAIPLIAKGNVKGVLEVFHRSLIQRDLEWLNFLETLGGQAAIAIDNAMLFDDLQHSHIELAQAYNATIDGWSHALDLRDKETEYHTRRVTDITLKLASLLNVPDDELVHIQRGAILHDIGKIGVPDYILHKPETLTKKEWVIMRKHPQYALDMLGPISYLKPALDIPHYHHEKWDGSGYPLGLKGTEIPLAARIFAVADVYDALTSARPYRSRWSHEKAQKYISSEAGAHFDPKIVSHFTKMMRGTQNEARSIIMNSFVSN